MNNSEFEKSETVTNGAWVPRKVCFEKPIDQVTYSDRWVRMTYGY